MGEMNQNFEREYDWNDTIEKDSEFIMLPEGDYVFRVESFERARHTPGPNSKLPACNKAVVKVAIDTDAGSTILTHNLFLHSSTEGILSAFFGAVGLKKKGEPLRMDWNAIIGKKGVCKVGTHEYNGNKYNDVKRMIYVEDVDMTKVLNPSMMQQTMPSTSQPAQQTAPVQQSFSWGQQGQFVPDNGQNPFR